MPADTVIFTGPVFHTHLPPYQKVGSIVVENGRITGLGTVHELRKLFPLAPVKDLGPGYAYPAFADAHGHLSRLGAFARDADLRPARSWPEVLDILIDHARTFPHGWLIGRGWDHEKWGNSAFPHREELDRIFPDRPVYLERIDIHTALVNETALRISGIFAGAAVDGGEVEMENGLPTGIVKDEAMHLVTRHIPPPDEKGIEAALLAAKDILLSYGVTSVGDALLTLEEAAVIRRLQEQGRYPLRVSGMFPADHPSFPDVLEDGPVRGERFSLAAIKVFTDGTLGARSGWLRSPYSDDAATTGLSLWQTDDFLTTAKKVQKAGFQLCVHAIGDAALAQTLEVFRQAMAPGNPLRWRIEHIQVASPDQVKEILDLGIVASLQPQHAASDAPWVRQRLGDNRMGWAYPLNSLWPASGYLALGSDFPVEPPHPLLGIHSAVFRPAGLDPTQVLSLDQALLGYTVGPAWAEAAEAFRGRIEPGFVADWVVFDRVLDMESLRDPAAFPSLLSVFFQGQQVV